MYCIYVYLFVNIVIYALLLVNSSICVYKYIYFTVFIALELIDRLIYFTRATDFVFMAGYGMSQPVGHLDFYPNNGKEQPGCDLTEGPLVPLTLVKQGLEEASRVLVACNHVRAIKLFTESINGKCPYIGKPFCILSCIFRAYFQVSKM